MCTDDDDEFISLGLINTDGYSDNPPGKMHYDRTIIFFQYLDFVGVQVHYSIAIVTHRLWWVWGVVRAK